MGLVEIFLAVLIVGISCVNAAAPAAAWWRSKDGRFLMLSAANVMLAVLGSLWVWGELPGNPPSWTAVGTPILVVTLIAVLLFLATTLWPRRT